MNNKLSQEYQDQIAEIKGALPSCHPDHLADLRKSGLLDQTIALAGVRSVRPVDIPKRLGWNPTGLTSVYEIPYPGVDGFSRFRCFYENGSHGPKYLQRKGADSHLFLPAMLDSGVLRDHNVPICITEGEKKALKATQEGLPCIGIGGLWNWRRRNGKPIEDFNKLAWKDRDVVIVPDNDWLKPNRHGYRKNLKQAVHGLAYALIYFGARVFVLFLPEDDRKIGLDDYLIDHTIDDFLSLPRKEIRKLNIEEAIEEATRDDLPELLKRLSGIKSEVECETHIWVLAERLGISRRALKADLKAIRSKRQAHEINNAVLAHPSYEVNNEFLALGFRETIIVDGAPADKNFRLISHDSLIKQFDHPIIDLAGKKIVFDERDRTLIRLSDRWLVNDMLGFLGDPKPPKGVYVRLKEVLHEYLELQKPSQYGLMAAWIIATYFHRIFNAMPFVHFFGRKLSGKSRALAVFI